MTKAETIEYVKKNNFNVPDLKYFTVSRWEKNREEVLDELMEFFNKLDKLAVRSSAIAEDSKTSSLAGQFKSLLNISLKRQDLVASIDEEINSYDYNPKNQVLTQVMINDSFMSGVLMSKSLDDGSPYYVINYDDKTGRTDSVTSGDSINKTVYIYNGVKDEDFDSPYLKKLIETTKKLEDNLFKMPLDIEFVIDSKGIVNILQVRPITTVSNWNSQINSKVSSKIKFLRKYVDSLMKKRIDIYGEKTLLGIMSDWNPAEMIGTAPKRLSSSLYRYLITKNIWAKSRAQMGYKNVSSTELMVSLFGRTYIDIRASLNSFLPKQISSIISEKIINAYIKRLEENPHLHDKIEFDIAFTCYEKDLAKKFEERYPGVLDGDEIKELVDALRVLTITAVSQNKNNSLSKSLELVEHLKSKQKFNIKLNEPFQLANYLSVLLDECKEYGTLPFAIIARHAFISEVLIRNFKDYKCLSSDRLIEFKKSVKTVASEMSNDFFSVSLKKMSKQKFIELYGHLRPSSYDIMSDSYADRPDIFEGNVNYENIQPNEFILSQDENEKINLLLKENKFENIDSKQILDYIKSSIISREYAKFIFTKHLNQILNTIVEWGEMIGFTKEDLSMLKVSDITESVFSPISENNEDFYRYKIEKERENNKIANMFKLNYLIRSSRDINIVPIQRNTPNFIGLNSVEGKIKVVSPYQKKIGNLSNKIVLIESADPGYDWIFSKGILALVTKYGGVNSHMSIRCAELSIPAVIGCGEQNFERIKSYDKLIIDCIEKKVISSKNKLKIL